MGSFFEMGGYGGFVWPAYIVTFGAMAAVLIVSWRAWKAKESELAQLQDQLPDRAARRAQRAQAAESGGPTSEAEIKS